MSVCRLCMTVIGTYSDFSRIAGAPSDNFVHAKPVRGGLQPEPLVRPNNGQAMGRL